MKNIILILLFLFTLDQINYIECQSDSDCGTGEREITISYYDTTPFINPDFNFLPSYTPPTLYYGDFTFLANTLGPDRKPVYKLGDQSFSAPDIEGKYHIVINNQTTFDSWFRSDPCISYPTTIRYKYTDYGGSDDLLFSIQCLPLDGGGFANQTVYPNDEWERDHPQSHNYYFCGEMHFTIDLIPSDTESSIFISTTNDLILYVDNNLEVAGILRFQNSWIKKYPASSVTRQLPVDLFFCNKGQPRFSLQIQVVQGFIFCKWYDSCGVCEGDNSTCPCTQSTICEIYDDECKTCSPIQCPVNNRCELPGCSLELGCYKTNISCWDHSSSVCEETRCNEEGTIDEPLCIVTPIENCIPCNDVPCITQDNCKPILCLDGLCIETFIDCNYTDPCLDGYCLDGTCHSIDICITDTLSTTVSSTVLSSTLISSTTLGPVTTTSDPVTVTETASTVLSTILSSTSISSTTTSHSTTGSSIATTTDSSIIITGETIQTLTTESTSSPTTSSSSTIGPLIQVKCDEFSCPHHYCCIEINKSSYTCISKYFELHCQPERFKQFY